MCWKCDNPDATEADYFALIQERIDRDGFFVQGVDKDRWRPGYVYTVGLTLLGQPEVVVTGRPFADAAGFLHHVGHALTHHGAPPFIAGDFHRWQGGPPVEVVEVAQPTVHLVMAHGMYGDLIRAVQLVYADDHDRWPWEVGFRGQQPVLGPRFDQRSVQ